MKPEDHTTEEIKEVHDKVTDITNGKITDKASSNKGDTRADKPTIIKAVNPSV